MKKVLIEILLIPVAVTVFSLLSVVGIIYTFFKHVRDMDYSLSKQLFPILRSFNLCFDGFANAAGGELMNDALKISGRIKYGKWYQTISAVSGLIFTFSGRSSWLREFLNGLEKDHCEKAITPEDKFYWENNIDNK